MKCSENHTAVRMETSFWLTTFLIGALCALPCATFSQSESADERAANLKQQLQNAQTELLDTKRTVCLELYQKWGYFEYEKLTVLLPKQINQLRSNLEDETKAKSEYKDAADNAQKTIKEDSLRDKSAKSYSLVDTNVAEAVKKPYAILHKYVDGNSQLAELRQRLKDAEYKCGQMRGNAPAIIAADRRVINAEVKKAAIAQKYQFALGEVARVEQQKAESERQTMLLDEQNKKLEDQKAKMDEQNRLLQEQDKYYRNRNSGAR